MGKVPNVNVGPPHAHIFKDNQSARVHALTCEPAYTCILHIYEKENWSSFHVIILRFTHVVLCASALFLRMDNYNYA